mgnify:FL=1
MTSKKEIENYLKNIPTERAVAFDNLIRVIKENIPEGFEESFQYGMISYVVPHSIYPKGYHVNPKIPLPFISIANQKNFIALYHMGIYADLFILDWFVNEYPKHCRRKLDMGKSCIRFKKTDEIPFELIKELMNKISCDHWINIYESNIISK